MRIIRRECKWFSKHLLRQKHTNCGYRLSKYVIKLDVAEGHLLYNILSGAMYLIHYGEESSYTDTLIENWFYVPNDFNELDWVDFLRKKKEKETSSNFINGYTVMTTLDCNARCFYCYEKGRPRISMSDETSIRLARYIINNANHSKVHISWFGGEPLMNYKVIDIICEKLASANLSYTSSMISNGLLFSSSLIEKAINNWNLKKVQITLDGTKNVYNKSKSFVNSNGYEFEKVLNNIEELLKADIIVSIRLNQDIHNTDDLLNLIDLLKERFYNYKKLSVYNYLLFNAENTISEKQQICYFQLRDKIELAHLSSKHNLHYGIRMNYCMADNLHSRVITPDGKIGKCEHFSSENLIGSLYEESQDEEMLTSWLKKVERQEACYSCSLYPLCSQIKMCPNRSTDCSQFERERRLTNLKQAILDTYSKYRKKINSEI